VSCARYRAQLSRYLDDELPPRQRNELLAHVATCPDCAAALARFRQSEVLLKKLPESKPSAEVRGAVLRAARRRRRAPHGVRGHLIWWLAAGGRINPVWSLGTLLVVIGVGVLALTAQTFPALSSRLGLAPPPTPTSSYLDVPASPTPMPGSALTPRLVSSNPFDGERDVDIQRTLTVRFDQAMERRSVERAFRLDPPAPGTFAWDADNELRFTPGAPGLLRGVTYTVALSDGARSLSGATLPPGPLWSFVTLDPPVLLDVSPAPGASSIPPTSTLVLTFSQPMDPASVEGALRLTGDTGAEAAWHLGGAVRADEDGRVLRASPVAPLPAGRVTVTLAGGARDKAGGALVPATWSFQVAPRNDLIVLDGPRLLTLALTANGVTPPVTYEVGPGAGEPPPSRATFTLYALPPDRLSALLPWLVADRANPAAGPWPPVDPAGLRVVQTWTSSLPPGRDLSPGGLIGQTVLPVREPGAYLLTVGPAGAAGDQRVVLVNEAGPVILAAGDRWLVWTGDLAAHTAGQAHVRLFTADGATVLEGDADRSGLFSAALPPGAVPAGALVTQGSVPSLALVAPVVVPPGHGAPLTATVITDRPQYAPGDAVRYTAVVPGAADDTGSSAATIQVRLRDPADRILGVLTLKPDRLGAVVGSFSLAPALPAGTYALEVETGGALTRHPLPVVPPVPPAALQLQLATPVAGPLFAGTVFTPTLIALDAAGTPMPGVVVTITLAGGVAAGAPLTGTTDANGLLSAALPLPPLTAPAATLWLTAEGRDPVGNTAQFTEPLPVQSGRLALRLALSGHAFSPGDAFTATVEVHDLAGQPVAGQPVTVSLYTLGGRNEPADNLNSVPGMTNAAGQWTTSLPLPLQGNFVVRAVTTDTGGVPVAAEGRLWVYDAVKITTWAVPALAADDLLATADQTAYAPGSTARLLVQSGSTGPLLVMATLNGSLTSQQVVTVSSNGALVAVPVPPAVSDGAVLTVTFLHYVAGSTGVHLVRSDVPLAISAPATQLAVDLQLDDAAAEYHPGDSMLIHVRLRDSAGRPQVGQAVLALAAPGSAPPTSPSDGPIVTGSAWAGGASPTAEAAVAGSPGAGQPPAYWNAALLTDASGQASVTVPVPAGAGTWQLQAWGFAPAGLAGHAATDLAVRSTLDLHWNPPDALVQGDSLRLQAVARNTSTEPLSADVRLTANGTALHLDSAGLVSLTLAPGETRVLEWRVDATGAGAGQLVLEAGWGPPGAAAAGRSRRESALTVAPYGTAADQYHAGTLTSDETVALTLPAEATPAAASLDVRVDPTLGGVLVDTLAAQLDAGAGQGAPGAVAERLTVGAVVSRLARLGRVPADSLPETLSAAQALDLQVLYQAQNADGSWGVWPGSAGDTRTTAAVLEALWLLADEQAQGGAADGPAVDRGTRDRGVTWLRTAAAPPAGPPGPAAAPGSDPTAAARAQALYVLSLYNSADRDAARQLIAAGGQLSPAGRGWLALALQGLGSHAEALTLLAGMPLPGAAPTALPASGQAAPGPLTTQDLAVGLQAVLAVDPDGQGGQDVGRVAAALLAGRQGTAWAGQGTTAAAVQALAAWVPRAPAATNPNSMRYRVLVNGQQVEEAVLGPRGSGGTLRVQVPGSALRAGENAVRLVADGDITLYYSLHLAALVGTPARPPVGDHAPGFVASLLREVVPAGGGGWRTGATVQVTLTLTLGQPVPGFRLNEPLPGAFGAPGDARLMQVDPVPGEAGAPLLLGSSTANGRTEFRLGPLPAGTYRLSYIARLEQAGAFGLLPAVGRVPAAPDWWVRSSGRLLTIER
jgi:hypothetical protein